MNGRSVFRGGALTVAAAGCLFSPAVWAQRAPVGARPAATAAAPAAAAAVFPDSTWVDVAPRVELMPRAKGEYAYQNWLGSLQMRTTTGEALALDGFSGELNQVRIGYTTMYPNSLYGLDASARVLKQYDILRWSRSSGAKWEPHSSLRSHDSPLPRQVYGCFAYAPTTDCVYLMRGQTRFGAAAGVADERYNPIHLWAYSFQRNEWGRYPTDPAKLPPLSKPAGLNDGKLVHVPAAEAGHPGHLYFFESLQVLPVWRFDLKTAEWSAHSKANPPIPLSQVPSCVDTKRRLVLFLKSGEDQTECELFAYAVDTGQWQQVPAKSPKPTSPRVMGGICYIPDLDRVLVYGGENMYDHWLYDPDNGRWVSLASLKPPPEGEKMREAKNATQRCCSLVWDPMHKLVILQRQVKNAPTWLAMRLVPDKIAELKYR